VSALRPELPAFAGIHFTFDDGPDPEWTPRCLDVLAHVNAKATFFMIGEKARAHGELARRIMREGHQIGNHTLSHAHPWRLSASRARAEVRDGAVAIADVLGIAPKFFRPPHGARRRCMLEQAEMQGEHVLMWDVSAIDWGWLGTSNRIASRLARVRDGQIVLMHDGKNRHNRPGELLKVLPQFLESLRQGDR
jgi:peptidoglycan/xylan/chitin deacetylase (PgdA/CDA1 family)